MRKKGKNRIIENLQVESVAAEGKCIAHVDGKVVFLRGAETAPGDVIDARVTQEKKAYLEATPIHYHKKSEHRIEPFCYHFGTCGGCKWQHLDYNTQLNFKQQQVIDQLERIGNLSLPQISPIIHAAETTLYRNKLEFTFTPSRWLMNDEIQSGAEMDRRGLGFHAPGRFDKIIDIEHCYLQSEPSNELRLFVKFTAINNNLGFYDIRKNQGFLRNLIIRTTSTGDIMVVLQVGDNRPDQIEFMCNEIRDSFPEITSLNYVINTKGNETFHDLEVVNFSGLPYITESLDGINFRIGPKSFFQTNTTQALRLYQEVRKLANLNGEEIVYDLYTGTGTIANYIAKGARKVVGIEYVPEAIEDAKTNSKINNIGNTEFFAGDIRELLKEDFTDQHGQPDVVITDPPRAGMHPEVVSELVNASPKRIVYISCNPATQARDIELMADSYEVKVVQPIDMFPHTHHVENIILLEKR